MAVASESLAIGYLCALEEPAALTVTDTVLAPRQ